MGEFYKKKLPFTFHQAQVLLHDDLYVMIGKWASISVPIMLYTQRQVGKIKLSLLFCTRSRNMALQMLCVPLYHDSAKVQHNENCTSIVTTRKKKFRPTFCRQGGKVRYSEVYNALSTKKICSKQCNVLR